MAVPGLSLLMAMKKTVAMVKCHPLIAQRWDDFVSLFGANGACGGCWCMLWRLSRREFERKKGAGNRAAMKAIVEGDLPPGILVYVGREPVGWCAIAPRTAYPALDRSRVLKPVDATPVWSISCLFVRKDSRKKGISVALLRAAIGFVRKHGGQVIEGYPVEAKKGEMPAVFAWTGVASAFRKAGFVECARRSATRPIMRYQIESA